jgi:NADH:ubiquinone oxidoreductase subunit E
MGNCKKSPNVMFDTERQEYMTPVKASKKALDSIKK